MWYVTTSIMVLKCNFCTTYRKAITQDIFHQIAKVKDIGEFVNIRSGLPTSEPKCSLRPWM